MTDSLPITPASGPVRGTIRPPGSKSITNRALACAALADGRSTLAGTLDSEDTRAMIAGLRALGIGIEVRDDGRSLVVDGSSGQVPAMEADLYCANSGTTIRFLASLASLGHGAFRLDGTQRMRERPIADLLDSLNQLGARTLSENNNGCPPVMVHANGLLGGKARLRGNISSQFLSGLLMAAPAAAEPVVLEIDGPLVSRPYVAMTLAVMQAFGVCVEHDQQSQHFEVNPAVYVPQKYWIEPDASAASYFWAVAAITGGQVTVDGLSQQSLQGDVAFVDALVEMGCEAAYADNSVTVLGRPLRGIDIDMNHISDTVQTLAAVALFAAGPTKICGVAHNRHKETDRIGNLATELRKLGAEVQEHDDGLTIVPGDRRAAEIETYDDHRMAMSLALAGLMIPGVRILDPGCTEKTYPDYFADLSRLTSNLR